MTLVFTLVAPIPVGHRVRITTYETSSEGVFSSANHTLPHEPVIEDLDTGVVYCSERPFARDKGRRPREPLGVRFDEPIATVFETVEGVVRACRVVTLRSLVEVELQTHLTLDPD